MRSTIAVLSGYLIFSAVSFGIFAVSKIDPLASPPPWFAVISVLLGGSGAAMGGYVSATVGKKSEIRHAMAVAAMILLAALVSLLAHVGKGSIWSELAVLFVMVPAAIAGGVLRVWLMKRKRL